MVRVPTSLRSFPPAGGSLARPVLVLTIACLLLLAAAWLVVPVLDVIGLPSDTHLEAAAPQHRTVLLFVSTDRLQADESWLTRRIFAATGFASGSFLLSEAGTQPVLSTEEPSALEAAVHRTARTGSFELQDTWVVAAPGAASAVLAALQPTQVGGLVLLSPPRDLQLSESVLSAWKKNGHLILFSTERDNGSAQRLFEQLTGEDATLFPGRLVGADSAIRAWQTADGRVTLTTFSGFVAGPPTVSPLVVAELAQQLSERTADTPYSGQQVYAKVLRQTAAALYRLHMALLLLLVVPILLLYACRTNHPADQWQRQARRAPSWIGSLLFWCASLIVATLPAFFVNRIAPQSISWPALLLLLTPACNGWLHFVWRTVIIRSDRPSELRGLLPAGQARGARLAAWVILLLVPVLLVLTGLALPGFSLQPPAGWLFLLFCWLNLALGPIGLSAWSLQPLHLRRAQWLSGLSAVLPWAAAVIGLLLTRGPMAVWPVLAVACLFFWSSRSGIAFALSGGSRWLASLSQSVCYTWLILPFVLSI